jgi:hypothetical protein
MNFLKTTSLRTTCFASALIACIVFALTRRLSLGVDLTDEAFYIAATNSFLMGQPSFALVVSPMQLASIFIAPFVAIYRLFIPDSTAIVLSLRYYYVCLTMITSLILFLRIRLFLSTVPTILIACLPMAWMPFSLPACSYNTLALNFFLMAMALNASVGQKCLRTWLAISILLFMACVAYPTFSVVALIYFTASFFSLEKLERLSLTKAVLLFLGLSVFTGCALIAFEGLAPFVKGLHWTSSHSQYMNSYKLSVLSRQFTLNVWIRHIGLSLLFAITFLICRDRGIRLSSLIAFPIVLAWIGFNPSSSISMPTHEVITSLTFSYVFYLFFIEVRCVPLHKQLNMSFICAFCAGLVTTWSSANGLLNFAVGSFPAVIFGGAIFAKRMMHQPHANSNLQIFNAFSLILLSFFVLGFSFDIYGEAGAKPKALTWKIREGPFKNLRTVSQRGHLIEQLQDDLRQYCSSKNSMYVIGASGIYLLGNANYSDPVLFHQSHYAPFESLLLDYFFNPRNRPDFIVQMIKDPYFGVPFEADRSLIRRDYLPLKTRDQYVIFQRNIKASSTSK